MVFRRAGDSEATPSGHPHHLLLYSCLGSVGSCLWPHRSSQCPQVVAAWVLASELSSCLQEPQTLEPPRASGWLSFLRTQDACFLQNVRAEKDPFGLVPSSADGETEAQRGGKAAPGHMGIRRSQDSPPSWASCHMLFLVLFTQWVTPDQPWSLSSQSLLQNGKTQTTSGSVP